LGFEERQELSFKIWKDVFFRAKLEWDGLQNNQEDLAAADKLSKSSEGDPIEN
jgi:hypothetical protein